MASSGSLTGEVKSRVVILNKFGARHPSITGRSSRDMADYLTAHGFEVIVLSIHAPYKGQVGDREEQLPYQTIELSCWYNGNNKLLRLIGNLADGFRLVFSSLFLPRHQAKIVMTDPSLINAWALLFRPFCRSKLVFWTMDLYPNAFAAAGLVSKKNLLYRALSSFVYGRTPDYLITLGEQQYRYLCRSYKTESIPHIILPCGIYVNTPSAMPSWRLTHPGKIIFCYAGNIGEAHSASFLVELVNRLDPVKHAIVLSLYGTKAAWVWNHVNNDDAVVRVGCVSRSELQYVDINVASLLPAWNHVCVPSKLVSAICAGTPVLYNANEESEGACMFPDAVWLLPDSGNLPAAVSAFLDGLSEEEIALKRKAAEIYSQKLINLEHNKSIEFIKANLMRKSIKKNLAIADGGVLFLFVASEVYLRQVWGFCDSVLIQSDPEFEYIAQPNQNRYRFKKTYPLQ